MSRSKILYSGTIWTTISSITTSAVQLLRLAILTRLLAKSDFGIVTILTIVLGLTQTLGDLGFSSAIMHKKEITRNEFSSLYWIQFILFILFYLIAISLRFVVASVYKEPSVVSLLPIAMLDILFQGFGKLYDVLAQKRFQFRILAIRNIASSIASLVVAAILAWKGYGVYSLIISSLTHTFILQIWNFIVGQRYIRLSLYLSPKEVFPLIRIGLYQMGTQILDYLSSKIDVILLGKFLGTELLGAYNLAKELVLKVVAIVNSIANRVVMPFFSAIQDDEVKMRDNYCRLLSILSYVNFPVCLGVGALSTLLVPLIYGPSYSDLSPIVTILSFWGLLVCVCNPAGNIVTAKGRTDLSFIYTIVRFLVYFPMCFLFAPLGLRALSFGMVGMSIIMLIVAWALELRKTIQLTFKQYLFSFVVNFAITSLCIVGGYLFTNSNLFLMDSVVFRIIVYGFIVYGVYALLVVLLDRTRIRGVLDYFGVSSHYAFIKGAN